VERVVKTPRERVGTPECSGGALADVDHVETRPWGDRGQPRHHGHRTLSHMAYRLCNVKQRFNPQEVCARREDQTAASLLLECCRMRRLLPLVFLAVLAAGGAGQIRRPLPLNRRHHSWQRSPQTGPATAVPASHRYCHLQTPCQRGVNRHLARGRDRGSPRDVVGGHAPWVEWI
jgi:hypothetical protein